MHLKGKVDNSIYHLQNSLIERTQAMVYALLNSYYTLIECTCT